MKAYEGKGIFLWQTSSIKNGDPYAVADLLNSAKIIRVEIKVCEGPYKYRPSIAYGLNVTPEWLAKLRERYKGSVGGWGFNYGNDTEGEGEMAAIQVNELGLDYYVFDAESFFESKPDIIEKAEDMIQLYRSKSKAPVGWCTWALWRSSTGVQWHNIALAKKAVSLCDFAMPMVYWSNMGAQAASSYLAKSLLQWKEITTTKPIIPAGRAYTGDGGTADAPGVVAFDQVTRSSKLLGESWWSLQHAIALPAVWEAVKALSPWSPLPTQPPTYPNVPESEWKVAITDFVRTIGYKGPNSL